MSERLSAAFRKNRAALVTFVTAGDPSAEKTGDILDALVEGGADVIELGMPFTDPMADGPSIQAGSLRALKGGMTLKGTLEIARAFRGRHPDVPLILMGYLNPALAYGPHFARDAAAAGVDGLILVDLPPEEDAELGGALRGEGLSLVRLATPTTDRNRLPAVLEGASGFLYYVSVAGVTGTRAADTADVAEAVGRIKAETDLPVAVGFGIRTAEQAADIARIADGVVVGSAIVDLIGENAADPATAVRNYVTKLSQAIETAA
ncbi:tryptophan synthase subunit alpha [Pacificimonas flava]|uniref:Tryptophan synthase alpha chain n=2 Tax=Pacificimonas TaxID=1960290 RepID=A0A219B193_9SPHN|nr:MULTISPECIES: tryptophan synthase subunit alpha [Pacificimonas]MBZ6378277.1 tryptophan synthase subunit alpha [Pacificimonas aurantium]OWV32107.1 tryptophan synthase subunit alpha [Pacificimonas flava]